MSGVVSRWLGSIEALPAIAERLLRVQIENRPALEMLKLYDDPSTFFYCDPPYVHESRGDSKAYEYELNDDEHRALAAKLNAIRGKAAVSGYRTKLYDTIFKAWKRIDAPVKQTHSSKGLRQECLWVNY